MSAVIMRAVIFTSIFPFNACALAKEADQPKQILRPGPIGGQPPIYGSPLNEEEEPYRGGRTNRDGELPQTRGPLGTQPTIIDHPSDKEHGKPY